MKSVESRVDLTSVVPAVGEVGGGREREGKGGRGGGGRDGHATVAAGAIRLFVRLFICLLVALIFDALENGNGGGIQRMLSFI